MELSILNILKEVKDVISMKLEPRSVFINKQKIRNSQKVGMEIKTTISKTKSSGSRKWMRRSKEENNVRGKGRRFWNRF